MNDDAGEAKSGFSETLRSVGSGASESVHAFAQTASSRLSEAAREAGRHARTDASQLADQASGQIKKYLSDKIGQGADLACEAAVAARSFADEIDEKAPTAAQTVRDAAGRFETFARGVGQLGPDELLDRAVDYARREPAIFIGAAAAIGFFAARLLKSRPRAPATAEPTSGESAHDA